MYSEFAMIMKNQDKHIQDKRTKPFLTLKEKTSFDNMIKKITNIH